MQATLTVVVHDRGKQVSTLPVTFVLDMVSSFGINAINQITLCIIDSLPDHVNKVIPINQFKKIVRMCTESEFDIPLKVTAHDRYDIRYNLTYVR